MYIQYFLAIWGQPVRAIHGLSGYVCWLLSHRVSHSWKFCGPSAVLGAVGLSWHNIFTSCSFLCALVSPSRLLPRLRWVFWKECYIPIKHSVFLWTRSSNERPLYILMLCFRYWWILMLVFGWNKCPVDTCFIRIVHGGVLSIVGLVNFVVDVVFFWSLKIIAGCIFKPDFFSCSISERNSFVCASGKGYFWEDNQYLTGKYCGLRSDCSYSSSPIWFYTFCSCGAWQELHFLPNIFCVCILPQDHFSVMNGNIGLNWKKTTVPSDIGFPTGLDQPQHQSHWGIIELGEWTHLIYMYFSHFYEGK